MWRQLAGKKGPELFKVDEHPRPSSNAEGLAKLPPVFKKNGTVTAANASGKPFFFVGGCPIAPCAVDEVGLKLACPADIVCPVSSALPLNHCCVMRW